MEWGTTKVELMKLGALQQSRQNRGPPQLIRQNGNTEHREIRVDLRCLIKTDRVLKGVLHCRNKSGKSNILLLDLLLVSRSVTLGERAG